LVIGAQMSGYFPAHAAETADSRSDVWVITLQIPPTPPSPCDNCHATDSSNAVKGTSLPDIS